MDQYIETEDVVFVDEARVESFGSGIAAPPQLSGKWYVYRPGYFVDDTATSPRTFYLQRGSGLWATRSEDGSFHSEADARRNLQAATSRAVARL